MVPPEPLGDGGDKNRQVGFKVITGILKIVAGLVVGFVATGILLIVALGVILDEMRRIDNDL